jgi:hypothetical protein
MRALFEYMRGTFPYMRAPLPIREHYLTLCDYTREGNTNLHLFALKKVIIGHFQNQEILEALKPPKLWGNFGCGGHRYDVTNCDR